MRYTPIYCWCVFLLIASCAHEPIRPLPPDYTWENVDYSYSSFHPFYHEGYHYIFPYKDGQVSMVKFDERDGRIVYDKPLFTTGELPNFIRTYYIEGDILILPHERYIRSINLRNGSVISTDTMPRYLDRTLMYNGKFTAGCYLLDKGKFQYIDILRKNRRFYDTLIYELDTRPLSYLFQGFPPFYDKGRWIMGTSMSERESLITKNELIIKDSLGSISTMPYCYENDWGFGQSNNFVVDDNNFYVECVDHIYSYKKSDLSQNWELFIEKGGLSQGLKLEGNKLYFLSEQYQLHVIDKHTGQQMTTMKGPVASSRMFIFDNKLYYVGRSPDSFYEVDLNTLRFKVYLDEESSGYDIGYSISAHSKLLFNHKKWLCTPL